MSLISSPAQPGRIVRLRKKTARLLFDPNLGFHKVERVALSDVGQETVRYVANGNSTTLLSDLSMDILEKRAK